MDVLDFSWTYLMSMYILFSRKSLYAHARLSIYVSSAYWKLGWILNLRMQILSNGAYKSIEHRATVNSKNERMSVAMFFNPKFEALVGPSHSLTNEENPPLFKRIPMEEYVKDIFSRKLIGKTFLEHMKIKN